MTVQLKRPRSETRAFQDIALANEDKVQEFTIQAFEGLCDNLETICPSVSTWRQEQNHTGEVTYPDRQRTLDFLFGTAPKAVPPVIKRTKTKK